MSSTGTQRQGPPGQHAAPEATHRMFRAKKARRKQKRTTATKRAYRVEQNDPRALEIQSVLEDDLRGGARLMHPSYREYAVNNDVLDGYCAAAAAAYFHLEP